MTVKHQHNTVTITPRTLKGLPILARLHRELQHALSNTHIHTIHFDFAHIQQLDFTTASMIALCHDYTDRHAKKLKIINCAHPVRATLHDFLPLIAPQLQTVSTHA